MDKSDIAKSLIGLTLNEVHIYLENSIYSYRVVSVDNEPRLVTADVVPSRFDLILMNDLVSFVG